VSRLLIASWRLPLNKFIKVGKEETCIWMFFPMIANLVSNNVWVLPLVVTSFTRLLSSSTSSSFIVSVNSLRIVDPFKIVYVFSFYSHRRPAPPYPFYTSQPMTMSNTFRTISFYISPSWNGSNRIAHCHGLQRLAGLESRSGEVSGHVGRCQRRRVFLVGLRGLLPERLQGDGVD